MNNAPKDEVTSLLNLLDAKFANHEPSPKLDAAILKAAAEHAEARRCRKRLNIVTPQRLAIAATMLLLASLAWLQFSDTSSMTNRAHQLQSSQKSNSTFTDDLTEASLQLAVAEIEFLYSQDNAGASAEDSPSLDNELQLLAAEMCIVD